MTTNVNWLEVLALVVLVLSAAFFAASEAALVSVSRVSERILWQRSSLSRPECHTQPWSQLS